MVTQRMKVPQCLGLEHGIYWHGLLTWGYRHTLPCRPQPPRGAKLTDGSTREEKEIKKNYQLSSCISLWCSRIQCTGRQKAGNISAERMEETAGKYTSHSKSERRWNIKHTGIASNSLLRIKPIQCLCCLTQTLPRWMTGGPAFPNKD